MITFVRGDLFSSPAKVLVNTVNTVGVMGKGIAKTFKDVFPEMFHKYQRLCEAKEFQIGSLWLYKTSHKWILNFPTKQHWRQPSKPEYIEAGLRKFEAAYTTLSITSIAFPQLGCGNGELDWETQVKPIMLRRLSHLPIQVFIYQLATPTPAPEHRTIDEVRMWLRSEPRSLGFAEVWTDIHEVLQETPTLQTWNGSAEFEASVVTRPVQGIRIRVGSKTVRWFKGLADGYMGGKWWWPRVVGPEEILIPQEAMLDLWQNIRAYGFCVPHMMSEGLDALAPYVMRILSQLDYMTPVELMSAPEKETATLDKGLQLLPAPATALREPSRVAYALQQM